MQYSLNALVIIIIENFIFIKKRIETSLHKKISKKKFAWLHDVGMRDSMHELMHWLTKKCTNKKCHAHRSAMHTVICTP